MNNKNLIFKLNNNELETKGYSYEIMKSILEASNGKRKKIEDIKSTFINNKVSFKIKEKEKEKKSIKAKYKKSNKLNIFNAGFERKNNKKYKIINQNKVIKNNSKNIDKIYDKNNNVTFKIVFLDDLLDISNMFSEC